MELRFIERLRLRNAEAETLHLLQLDVDWTKKAIPKARRFEENKNFGLWRPGAENSRAQRTQLPRSCPRRKGKAVSVTSFFLTN